MAGRIPCKWMLISVMMVIACGYTPALGQGEGDFDEGFEDGQAQAVREPFKQFENAFGDDGEILHHDIDETTVAVGGRFACALEDTGSELGGSVKCWGRDRHGILSPPKGTFIQICAAEFYACGITLEGELKCWGQGQYGEDKPGTYLQVSCGMFHTCAINRQNQVRCWGQDVHGQSSAPSDEFVQVSCGRDHTCALLPSGKAKCWGYNYKGATDAPQDVTFMQISASPDRHTCGVTLNGYVKCWGSDDFGEGDVPEPTSSARYIQVTPAKMFSCGLTEVGTVVCWGEPRMFNKGRPPLDTEFLELSSWDYTVCGVKADAPHGVLCWGGDKIASQPEMTAAV